MKRKEFIKTCGYGCLGLSSISFLLQSCVAMKDISVEITGDHLKVPKAAFKKKDEYVEYVIVRNEKLQFPIYVFRFSEEEYTALYLECTHQGNEVSAYGDKLVCSAHGSEFDNKGQVTSGPADRPLRSFPVNSENENLFISLRKS